MGKDKPRLGRGLASLVGQLAQPTMTADAPPSAQKTERGDLVASQPSIAALTSGQLTRQLSLDIIDPNPYQPRTSSDPQALDELVESIREHGIVQPIVVRPHDQRFQLIAGQRRLEAAHRAQLKTIPAIVRQATDQQVLEVALIENIHREDLNCVDRALAYKRYQESFALPADALAERLGQDRSTVANYLRLLSLPEEVLDLLRAERLSMGHARALAGLDNATLQIKLAVKIAQQDLSVRQAEQLAARSKGEQSPPAVKRAEKNPNVLDLEQQMTRALSTRVQIKPGRKKGSGKIIIEFYSFDDFELILDRICGANREEL